MKEVAMTGSNRKRSFLGQASLMACVFACSVFSLAAIAAADSSSADSSKDSRPWVKQVPELITKGEIKRALDDLMANQQTNDADWHNLMGFAYRKQQPPDIARSEFHYREALKIKADHRGALEYYGELLLMKNDLAGAEEMLKRLNKACFFGCEELRDLKKEIEAFKRR
jgi:Tfp pilus assembly protein PilF